MRFLFLALLLSGCSGTTGSGLVSFNARAGGPANANDALEFDTRKTDPYHVVLSSASFHLGAIYLNMSVPSSGGAQEPCVLPGIYVGEVFGGCTNGVCGVGLTNLLSSQMTSFPTPGEGTANAAVEAEVWLASGDINAADDPTPVFQVCGTASRHGQDWPFAATVTIGANRAMPPGNPATPGENPICRQRIVSLIRLDPPLTLSDGGTLDLHVDPSEMFNEVDFASLQPPTVPIPAFCPSATFVIPDENGGVGGQLFGGVTANSGVYNFSFTP